MKVIYPTKDCWPISYDSFQESSIVEWFIQSSFSGPRYDWVLGSFDYYINEIKHLSLSLKVEMTILELDKICPALFQGEAYLCISFQNVQ